MKILEYLSFIKSTNFWQQFITLVSMIVVSGTANIFPLQDANALITAIFSGDIALIVVAMLTFGNSVRKMVNGWEKTGYFWNFLKSANFWVAFISFAAIVVNSFGIIFPTEAAQQVVDAVLSGNVSLIIVAILNFANIIYTIIKGEPLKFGKMKVVHKAERLTIQKEAA